MRCTCRISVLLQFRVAPAPLQVYRLANAAGEPGIPSDAQPQRISGAKSIPISKLKIGSFHTVENKRLQVNASVERYQRELAYLVSVI